MQIPLDYKELLKILNRHKTKYLIVGAYAVAYYAEPRYTKDIDIWIESSQNNARKVYSALKKFGAPLENITLNDFTNENLVYQVGIAPIRVDIIMGLKGLNFEKAWENRTTSKLEGIKVNIMGLEELIKSKKRTNRDMNGRDLDSLRYVLRRKK